MTDDASDDRRDTIHKVLQEMGPPEGEPEGSLLTGWVIVTAWVDPTGSRFLAKAHAAEIASWMANGLHHEALYGEWPDPDE